MKKFLLFLCIFLTLTLPTYAATLYQTTTEERLSTGTNLKTYTRFISSGWLEINVLEVDLSDKYTDLKLLTSTTGAGKTQNLKNMSVAEKCLAAVNGDFFSASSGKGHSMGIAIDDGELVTSSYYGNLEKDEFATLLINNKMQPFYEFVSNEITLKSLKTKESINILEINKYPTTYNTPSIFTSRFGEYSIGSTSDMEMTEVVIENNKVIEVRKNMEPVLIPEKGYVVCATNNGADFLNDNFKVGTKVNLDVDTSVDIKKINFAISGGALLLENGKIPDVFSANISGTHPRTAIGTSKNGKTLFLVTVDGRQKNSVGMTQMELAEFLKEIDVYNAINLDGGGSTSMVAQRLGDDFLSVINSPSGGSLRNISNGVGILYNAPSSNKLDKLIIEVSDTNIFKGKKREVIVKGYNKYYSPIDVKESSIKWSYDGVPVTVEDGYISGETVGMTMLTASVGKVKATIEINILSNPHELSITPKKTTLTNGKTISFLIEAKNKNGYYSTLNSDEANFKIEKFINEFGEEEKIPNDAILDGYTFTATTSGDYILSVSDGDIKSYALVTVSGRTKTLIDDFEKETYTFDPYPDEVIGEAQKSSKKAHSGKYSVKLSYDFNQDVKIRAAYIVFDDDGITVPEGTTEISFWVYNDSPKDEQLKMKFKDADGKYHLEVIQKGLTHDGWKEFTYSTAPLALPAKLTDIYVAQDNIDIKSKGYIYVDDLSFYQETSVLSSSTLLPNDIKGIDELQKHVEKQNEDSYTVSVFSDTYKSDDTMIEALRNKKIKNIIDTSDYSVITNDVKEYSLDTYQNSAFITINASKSGIRATNSEQWINLQDDIRSVKADNIFIIMNTSLDNFSDTKEARLFIDMLCELRREVNKNIWVLHTGEYTDFSMKRGIRYLGTNNNTKTFEEIPQNSNYLLITVNGKDLSYEIKNIFEK